MGAGFLIPPWYEDDKPSEASKLMVSFIWGFSTAIAAFIVAKGLRQTYQMCRRLKRVNTYVILIWLELVTSFAMSIVCWLFLNGFLQPSFWVYFAIWFTWVFQIQCLPQIIINRLGVLITDQTRTRRLKVICALIVAIINISVACIWIPARLEISDTYIEVNKVWDRIEKIVFCILDLSLNLYFVYLVKSKLIANGLTKYKLLFRFNCCMIFISISLDIIIIGMMSIRDDVVYLQFHPLAYLVKLYIEMNMADLIRKVARATNNMSCSIFAGPIMTQCGHEPCLCQNFRTMISAEPDDSNNTRSRPASGVVSAQSLQVDPWGIHRTIETEVVVHNADGQKVDDGEARSSSEAKAEMDDVELGLRPPKVLSSTSKEQG